MAHPTISIHNYFATGEATVSRRSTNNETSRGVDMENRFWREVVAAHRLDDFFNEIAMDLFLGNFGIVLSRKHHCVD